MTNKDITWIPIGREHIFLNPGSKAILSPTGEYRHAKTGEWAVYPGSNSPWQATFNHGTLGAKERTELAIILRLKGNPVPRTFADRLRAALPLNKAGDKLIEEAERLERVANGVRKLFAGGANEDIIMVNVRHGKQFTNERLAELRVAIAALDEVLA